MKARLWLVIVFLLISACSDGLGLQPLIPNAAGYSENSWRHFQQMAKTWGDLARIWRYF